MIQKRWRPGVQALPSGKKRLLEQLQATKESLRSPVSAADNDNTSASPKEAKPPKRSAERPEHNHNWIPWIIGACLAGGGGGGGGVHLLMYLLAKTCACARDQRRWRQGMNFHPILSGVHCVWPLHQKKLW